MLSCLAPLFILTMIKGVSDKICSDKILIYTCSALVIIPKLIVLFRIFLAKKQNDKLEIQVIEVTQNKDYVFTYFFTVLLPLYGISISTDRELYAYLLAVLLIFIILFRLNLYYTNIFFIIFKYNVYILKHTNQIILSKNELTSGIIIRPLRLSNSVFIEI